MSNLGKKVKFSACSDPLFNLCAMALGQKISGNDEAGTEDPARLEPTRPFRV